MHNAVISPSASIARRVLTVLPKILAALKARAVLVAHQRLGVTQLPVLTTRNRADLVSCSCLRTTEYSANFYLGCISKDFQCCDNTMGYYCESPFPCVSNDQCDYAPQGDDSTSGDDASNGDDSPVGSDGAGDDTPVGSGGSDDDSPVGSDNSYGDDSTNNNSSTGNNSNGSSNSGSNGSSNNSGSNGSSNSKNGSNDSSTSNDDKKAAGSLMTPSLLAIAFGAAVAFL